MTTCRRTFELHPFQEAAREAAFEAWEGGKQHALVVMPTGTGKTVLAAGVIEEAVREHSRPALFVVHRGRLVTQAARTFEAYGLTVAVEMAGENAKKGLWTKPDVVVASVQTLQGPRLGRWAKDQFGLLISDEAHRGHKGTAMHTAIYEHFNDYWHMGITATPDGPGDIGKVFGDPIYELGMADAINDGWLVPIRAFKVPLQIDLRDIKITAGDFNTGDLALRVGPAVEDICRHVKRHVEGRFFCMFTPDVFSAKTAAETLSALGVVTKYVAGAAGTYGMPRDESDAILDQFGRREFQGVVCCDLLFEGWDARHVSAIIVARPTRKRYRYAQSVGRATRTCPEIDKKDALILDFDWQCDDASRDLCNPMDLFSRGLDPRVAEEARRRMAACGEGDPLRHVDGARASVFRPRNLNFKLNGVDSHVSIRAYDPLRAAAKGAGIALRHLDYDALADNPITQRQARCLNHLGLDDTAGLSKFGASKLIDRWGNRDPKLCSLRQHMALSRAGIDGERMSRREASDIIDNIINRTHQHAAPVH